VRGVHLMLRPCLGVPGQRRCLRLVNGRSRCAGCARTLDQRRGSKQERGYDAAHIRARASLATLLPADCAYGCGKLLVVGDAWVAAHVVDGDASAGWVVSCYSCNEKAKRGRRPVAVRP
jgi:hypothetical protein